MFQNMWNAVEGHPAGYGIKDYDVFFFDDTDLSWEAEDVVVAAAEELFAELPVTVEVRNEARVHLWYEQKFGVPAPAYRSATDAIGVRAQRAARQRAAPYATQPRVTVQFACGRI